MKLQISEKSNDSLKVRVEYSRIILNMYDRFLDNKLPNFALKNEKGQSVSSNELKKNPYTIIVFIVGGCAACFEEEADIWNQLASSPNNKNIRLFSINISLDKNLISSYLKEKLVKFPIFNDEGVFRDFFYSYHSSQVIGFLVDSESNILKVHNTDPSHHELTSKFTKNVLDYIQKKNPLRDK